MMKSRCVFSWVVGISALIILTLAVSPLASEPLLLDLPGDRVLLRYCAGSLDRAVRLQTRLELLMEDLGSWQSATGSLRGQILSRQEWSVERSGVPYGLPAILQPDLLLMPAWGDAGTVALWQRLLGDDVLSGEATNLRGSEEEGASLIPADLLGSLMATQRVFLSGEVRGESGWIDLLLSHLLYRAHLQRHHPDELALAERIFELLWRWSPQMQNHDESGGSARQSQATRDLLWAAAIWRESLPLVAGNAEKSLKRLLKRGRKSGGRVSAVLIESLSPGVEARLQEIRATLDPS